MSPPPWRFKQVEVFPPPGMKNSTAPAVQPDGHATLPPVAGLTQCPAFARSPLGGVAGAASLFGRVGPSGMPSGSGGGGSPVGQLLIVTFVFPFPVSVQYVSPVQLPFGAR